MAHPYRTSIEDHLDATAGCLHKSETTLDALATALDIDDLVELAEHIENLARDLYRLHVKIAGAVDGASPAHGVTQANRNAPFRRGRDLLRVRCRISGSEARRRITTATTLLPQTTLTGQELPPRHTHVSHAFTRTPIPSADNGVEDPGLIDRNGGDDADGLTAPAQAETGPEALTDLGTQAQAGIGNESLQIIQRVLRQATPIATPEDLEEADRVLSYYARIFDPDALTKVGQVILAHIDPDGREPTQNDLATRQGVRIGRTFHGLTHLDIWTDTLQLETLLTVFNTATNPRSPSGRTDDGTSAPTSPAGEAGSHQGPDRGLDTEKPRRDVAPGQDATVENDQIAQAVGIDPIPTPATATRPDGTIEMRTRAQKMLDALIAACQTALRTTTLPQVGGLPPQLVITMNLTDLTQQLTTPGTGANGTAGASGMASLPGAGGAFGAAAGAGGEIGAAAGAGGEIGESGGQLGASTRWPMPTPPPAPPQGTSAPPRGTPAPPQ